MQITRYLVILVLFIVSSESFAKDLDEIRLRGHILCGVNPHAGGFASQDAKGLWRGFDVDICRAVATAMFGHPDKVKYIPLNTQERFAALAEGRIDLLSRNSTWTLSRETEHKIIFPAITYYDGLGLMVRRSMKVYEVDDLHGTTVCVQSATTSLEKLKEFFLINVIDWEAQEVASLEEAKQAYQKKECDVLAADQSMLHAIQPTLEHPDQSKILSEVISKEPLAVAVRQGDAEWARIVRWVVYGLINAEESGLTSQNVTRYIKNNASPGAVSLMESGDEDWERSLHLRKGWIKNVIKHVGNYGEIFDRNLGVRSPIGMKRGLNALWKQGGLLYAPPIR